MDSGSVFFEPDKGPIGPFMQPPDQGSRVLPLFYLETRPIRSQFPQGLLKAPNWSTRDDYREPVGRRYPAPKALHNFTRRRNELNAAYRSWLRQVSSFGLTAMDAFRMPVARGEESGD